MTRRLAEWFVGAVTEFRIEPLVVPESITSPDAADFIAASDLINRETARIIGSRDYWRAPAERLPFMTAPGWTRAEFVAKSDGAIVGWGRYESLRAEGNRECSLELFVDFDYRDRGIGSAILENLLRTAAAAGRTELNARVLVREGVAGPQLRPTSGAGWVAAADDGVAFAVHRGFVLEDVEQINRLALPVEQRLLEERVEFARAGYGDDYELVHWARPTPDEYLDDITRLFTEMSTADPIGGHEPTPDVWDADRLREAEHREMTGPRKRLFAAARERASGALVAYTMLDVPGAADGAVNQWSTLVSAGHRAKRLGLAIKLENLRQLMDDYPGHPSVTTMNGENNRRMIALNESVGFALVGHAGNFRRSDA